MTLGNITANQAPRVSNFYISDLGDATLIFYLSERALRLSKLLLPKSILLNFLILQGLTTGPISQKEKKMTGRTVPNLLWICVRAKKWTQILESGVYAIVKPTVK